MRRISLILFVMLFSLSAVWGQSVGPVKVITPTKMDVSPPLRDLVRPVPPEMLQPHEIPNEPSIYEGEGSGESILDPVLQRSEATRPAGPTIQNFDGVTTGANPPDTNGEVGLSHFVQTVNVQFAIWDKSGNQISPPSPINALWNGFGGNCEFQNSGDPITLYDQFADRWVISQFTSPGGAGATECFAVSTSGDPTGTYFRYEFSTPGNDYPKFSVWDDGGSQSAYLGGIRNFSGAFNFDAYAFERDVMLAGGSSPQAVVFDLSALVPGANNFLPSDISGMTLPPLGTAGIFLGVDNPATVQDELEMLELEVDWNNVNNSTLTRLPDVPVASFDGNVCFFNRNCIPQPNTTVGLDGFADAMMFRLPYRNFGSHQSIVCTHTVDVGDFQDHAGIRWHELRNTGSGWTLFQEGTYSPDSNHRWMPSIEINANGDIMVGYSVSSSSTVFPSIRYVGRQAGDPLNQMTLTEGTIINGLGAQTSSNRWGDYTDMTVDPSDDVTFWYTNQYQAQQGGAKNTRIASMQATTAPPNMVMSITPVGSTTIPSSGGTLTFDITVTNISNTSVNLDVWNFITTPNCNEIGPTVGPINVNFPANTTKNFTNRTQNIPGGAPAGNYTLGFRLGGFPENVFAEDSFGFTKSAGPTSASKTVASLEGWESSWQEGSDVLANSAPESFSLDQNYPNPFNPSTVISYSLPSASHVKLTIYNTLGQEIATLVDQVQSAGSKTVSWNGTDKSGQSVSAGVYLYKLEAGSNVQFKKMTFVK